MRRRIVRKFKAILDELGLKQPSNDIAMKPEEAAEKAGAAWLSDSSASLLCAWWSRNVYRL